MHAAGMAMARDDLMQRALGIAYAESSRSPTEGRVIDASLCHGSAGVAHLFNRLYQSTGDPTLRRAALQWFEFILEQCAANDEYAFQFLTSRQDGSIERCASWSVVEGAAGLALTLIAATTRLEPTWDRFLCVS
jgi:lantibiotic biosynthesis protein